MEHLDRIQLTDTEKQVMERLTDTEKQLMEPVKYYYEMKVCRNQILKK